jgi:Flp pilus assembly protein TadG
MTDRGQALAEFALVAPIMALILVSVVQLAIIFERQIGIENAVRDAARRGATFQTDTPAEVATNAPWVVNLLVTDLIPTNVQDYIPGALSASVCYSDELNSANLTEVVIKVTATYEHPLFLPLISQILDGIDGSPDNAFKATTSAQFVVQNDATANESVAGSGPCPQASY